MIGLQYWPPEIHVLLPGMGAERQDVSIHSEGNPRLTFNRKPDGGPKIRNIQMLLLTVHLHRPKDIFIKRSFFSRNVLVRKVPKLYAEGVKRFDLS